MVPLPKFGGVGDYGCANGQNPVDLQEAVRVVLPSSTVRCTGGGDAASDPGDDAPLLRSSSTYPEPHIRTGRRVLLDQVLTSKSRTVHLDYRIMSAEKARDGQRAEAIEKYSVFTAAEKWYIVAMVSYAAWFSTLSSFIYYPAIHQLSQIFSVSINKINLTVTSYMAVATVAPTLVGDTADVLGRRPVYVIALSLYMGANIAIVLSNSYPALLGLRVLQALAISGMLES